jgi:hypothetical protein
MTELHKARFRRCDARNTFCYGIVSYAAALTSLRAAKALMVHLRVHWVDHYQVRVVHNDTQTIVQTKNMLLWLPLSSDIDIT